MKKTNEHNEQFYLEKQTKITRVAVKKYSKDDLYKEYLKLYEIVNILQNSYSNILKSEWKEASDNTKLKDKVEELELEIKDLNQQLELYKGISEIEKKEKDEYLGKYLNLKNSTVKNERGAGRKNKFNSNQVEEIKELRGQGESIRSIAAKFNCSVGLIHKIINEQYPKEKDNKPDNKNNKIKSLKDYSIQDLKNIISLKKSTIEALNISKDSDQYKEYLKVVEELKSREEN